jgi:hypothetical protein
MARIGYPDDSNPEVAALHTKPFIEHWHYWKKTIRREEGLLVLTH